MMLALIVVLALAYLPDGWIGSDTPSPMADAVVRPNNEQTPKGVAGMRVERTSQALLFRVSNQGKQPTREQAQDAPPALASSVASDALPSAQTPSVQLVGVSHHQGQMIAIVQIDQNSSAAKLGDMIIDGYRVTAIADTCLTLSKGKQSQHIALQGFTCD
jgi:hypothetical protein